MVYTSQTYPELKTLDGSRKAVQREDDRTDRAQAYKDMIRVAGCAQDLDLVHYELLDNGEILYIGVFEITKRDLLPQYPKMPPAGYFTQVLKRFNDTMQGQIARDVAKKLDCDAYVIVYQDDCEKIWRYNLTKNLGWKADNNLEEHVAWITNLRKLRLAGKV